MEQEFYIAERKEQSTRILHTAKITLDNKGKITTVFRHKKPRKVFTSRAV